MIALAGLSLALVCAALALTVAGLAAVLASELIPALRRRPVVLPATTGRWYPRTLPEPAAPVQLFSDWPLYESMKRSGELRLAA